MAIAYTLTFHGMTTLTSEGMHTVGEDLMDAAIAIEAESRDGSERDRMVVVDGVATDSRKGTIVVDLVVAEDYLSGRIGVKAILDVKEALRNVKNGKDFWLSKLSRRQIST